MCHIFQISVYVFLCVVTTSQSDLIEKPEILKIPSSFTQPKGTSFLIFCNLLKGTKPLKFQWFKDGHEIDNSKSSSVRYTIDIKPSFSQFTLNDIDVNDSGNYSCVASNEIAFDSQWTILTVKGLILVLF